MRAQTFDILCALSLWLLTSSPLMAAAPAPDDATLNPLDQAVGFFQTYVSPIDGPRCQMDPTCSAYARQALRKHGMWMGLFIAVDRLLREIDPLERHQPILKSGVLRYADPLSANDVWLNPVEPSPFSTGPDDP